MELSVENLYKLERLEESEQTTSFIVPGMV
mgnify:FL=1